MTTTAQIAADLPGYDPGDLPADAVGAFLERLVEPLAETEDLALAAALGRVLAQDVVSPVSVPPHDNSAMDGYAFDGALLQPGQPLVLRCVGTALAGQSRHGAVPAGSCVRIMTGAVMPEGLDTVVPIEHTSVAGDTVHVAADALRPGANRRLRGEDLMQGRVALAQGTPLTPAALGLLASLGLPRVPVVRRLRVAYFSTGDELLGLGEPPREGAVYDSNRYTLFGLLTRLGVEVVDLGVVPDDPQALSAAFRTAAQQADAIVTSGGVSMGDADHTRGMMQELGDVAFWRIAMRPGRPMAVGRIARGAASAPTAGTGPNAGSAVLFGLPGNPVAVMVTFLAFVRPALLRMMGSRQSPPPLLRAVCATPLRKRPGRTEYQRGWVSTAADGTLQVRTTGNQGSGMLSSMVQANGLIVLPHGRGDVAAGEPVDVLMFEGAV